VLGSSKAANVACLAVFDPVTSSHGRPEYWSEMGDMSLDPVPR
jgi:hypothetical protein